MAITRKVAGFISACVCATASPALAENGITVPPSGGIVSTGDRVIVCRGGYHNAVTGMTTTVEVLTVE